MKNLWLFALLAMLAAPLSAQTTEHPFDSGNAFSRVCSMVEKTDLTPTEKERGVGCLLYIAGFVQGAEISITAARDQTKQPTLPMPFCRPDGVETGQLIRIVLKYIRENPEDAHQSTMLVALWAFQKAFPCPASK